MVRDFFRRLAGLDLTLAEFAVAVVLCWHYNDDPGSEDYGRCDPGIKTIAREARMTPRSAIRVLGRLESKGLLSWDHVGKQRRDQHNRYWGRLFGEEVGGLRSPTQGLAPAAGDITGGTSGGVVTLGHRSPPPQRTSPLRPVGVVTLGHQGGDPGSPGVVTLGHRGGDPGSPKQDVFNRTAEQDKLTGQAASPPGFALALPTNGKNRKNGKDARPSSAGRKIVAKYPGTCGLCRQRFASGEAIWWRARGKPAAHLSCWLERLSRKAAPPNAAAPPHGGNGGYGPGDGDEAFGDDPPAWEPPAPQGPDDEEFGEVGT